MGTPIPISSGGHKDWVEPTRPQALVATEVGLPGPPQPPLARGAGHSLLSAFTHSALFKVIFSRKLRTDISTSGILVPVSVDIDSRVAGGCPGPAVCGATAWSSGEAPGAEGQAGP